MNKVGRAIALAARVHRDQADKAGQPYILHPIRVMQHQYIQTDEQKIVAVLHDVLEDVNPVERPTLIEDLFRDFGHHISSALLVLRRDRAEPYESYIKRIKDHSALARSVKIADLTDNMNAGRLGRNIHPQDLKRQAKYCKALIVLSNYAVSYADFGEPA